MCPRLAWVAQRTHSVPRLGLEATRSGGTLRKAVAVLGHLLLAVPELGVVPRSAHGFSTSTREGSF